MESAPYYGKLDRSGMTSVPGTHVQPSGNSEYIYTYEKLDQVSNGNTLYNTWPLSVPDGECSTPWQGGSWWTALTGAVVPPSADEYGKLDQVYIIYTLLIHCTCVQYI